MMRNQYNQDVYKNRYEGTAYAARVISKLVLSQLPPIRSCADVGCGVGAWLSAFVEFGVKDIQGFDGEWVDESLLAIPPECFKAVDLENPLVWPRRFDLVVSLEVAEHISEANAGQFVDSLCNLSDFVLFSAAIPLQGGVGHVNEQPPQYWAKLFRERGYVQFDTIRHKVWDDEQIPSWYRQNIFLYLRSERTREIVVPQEPGFSGAHLVHPSNYEEKVLKLYQSRREISELKRSSL